MALPLKSAFETPQLGVNTEYLGLLLYDKTWKSMNLHNIFLIIYILFIYGIRCIYYCSYLEFIYTNWVDGALNIKRIYMSNYQNAFLEANSC